MSLAQAVSTRYRAATTSVSRYLKLERLLTLLCILIPAALILFDGGPVRGTISAYYNMTEREVFYFPLTVAAMLFVVNGVVKDQHGYNTFLGLMLAGVILFNCDQFSALHLAFAILFFGGNAFVILVYSSWKSRAFKGLLLAIIAVAMAGCFVFHWFSLFWAEWLSFTMIAVHFIIEDLESRRARLP